MKYSIMTILVIALVSCQSDKSPKNETVKEVAMEMPADASAEETKAPRLENMPDFATYTDVKQKKKAFFDFLRPMVNEENDRLKKDRERIESLYVVYKEKGSITDSDNQWIVATAEELRVKDFDISNGEHRIALLKKNDIVPASLFLAQAANESSWGTSRFAKEANNLFGQWCFKKGCGIIPSKRAAGETHEVQKFATVNDAVYSYVRNINSHPAYEKLRNVRIAMRTKGITPTGEALAVGLVKYSARGEEYVKEIQAMIRVNKLETSS